MALGAGRGELSRTRAGHTETYRDPPPTTLSPEQVPGPCMDLVGMAGPC